MEFGRAAGVYEIRGQHFASRYIIGVVLQFDIRIGVASDVFCL